MRHPSRKSRFINWWIDNVFLSEQTVRSFSQSHTVTRLEFLWSFFFYYENKQISIGIPWCWIDCMEEKLKLRILPVWKLRVGDLFSARWICSYILVSIVLFTVHVLLYTQSACTSLDTKSSLRISWSLPATTKRLRCLTRRGRTRWNNFCSIHEAESRSRIRLVHLLLFLFEFTLDISTLQANYFKREFFHCTLDQKSS